MFSHLHRWGAQAAVLGAKWSGCLLLLAGAGAAQAQGRVGYSSEDTVLAVRRLFAARDKAATQQLARSLGALAGGATVALLPAPFGQPPVKTSLVVLGLVGGGSGASIGLIRMHRYSARRRDEVLAAYRQGEPLPRYVRRRLQPSYFPAAHQRPAPE